MRNLASIQRISKLDPIPGKDRILLASFKDIGFHVIVGKNDFNIGDLCCYFEIDSLLPEVPCYEFLRKRCYNSLWQGHRIRSMKMAGIYSEGLALPLSQNAVDISKCKEGLDVTDLLKIRKYDPEALEEQKLLERQKSKHGPIMLFLLKIPFIKNILYPRRKTNAFPKWASRTDETRVQILPYVYSDYKGVHCYSTEKVDGQSITVGMVNRKFTVCSRNLSLSKHSLGKYAVEKSNYWKTVEKYDLEKKLRNASKELGINLYIQGEQCGPGIQKNKYGLTETILFVFNIFDITHKRYFNFSELKEFCETYQLPIVPFLEELDFNFNNVDQLVEYAKGNSILNKNIPREGIVIRSTEVMPPGLKMANMMSFKVINPDFTLQYGGD